MDQPISIEDALGQKLLLGFSGAELPSPELRTAFQKIRPGGVSLHRTINLENPAQTRQLTAALQQAAREASLPPLLIAADQEGGQLMAVGEGVTQLPGNMALGAVGDSGLAYRAGQVLGQELAAMGINVNYAPVCDVNVNPRNPSVGVRSFGEDPSAVASLAAAMIQGIQSAGVAATAKHFPGNGDAVQDPHFGLPSLPHDLRRLERVEFPPFMAAIQAGVKLIMTAHLALPEVEGQGGIPATLSEKILGDLLRHRFGFKGVILTDAMNMDAIQQGDGLKEMALRAVNAGADVLLLTNTPEEQCQVAESLRDANQEGRLNSANVFASAERILALKHWLAEQEPQPGLELVGGPAHTAVAEEIAARSITLVRDRAHLLPLNFQAGQRLAVVLPQPADLTPADTSSYVVPSLAQALREYHPDVSEYILPHSPSQQDIEAVLPQLKECDGVVLGTINALTQPAQVELVHAVLATGIPTIIAALRLPYDLAAFPEAQTYLCTYSVLEPSLRALAKVLFGKAESLGYLPVTIPGMYLRGQSDG